MVAFSNDNYPKFKFVKNFPFLYMYKRLPWLPPAHICFSVICCIALPNVGSSLYFSLHSLLLRTGTINFFIIALWDPAVSLSPLSNLQRRQFHIYANRDANAIVEQYLLLQSQSSFKNTLHRGWGKIKFTNFLLHTVKTISPRVQKVKLEVKTMSQEL